MATAPDLTSNPTAEMAPPRLGSGDWTLTSIQALPERIDDATMASLEAVDSSPLPKPQPCDERHFNQCFAVMDAALPKRSQDDVSGELLARTYRRMLGHLTKPAINHLSARALAECRWFPTVAECLAMAEGFREPPSDERLIRDAARGRIGREQNFRFGDAMAAIDRGEMDADAFAALPERWRGMAVESGRAWALSNGSYGIRPIDPEARRARAAQLLEAGLL